MRALDRKLLRDLEGMKGQVVTIALVVASGMASFVTLRSTWDSLLESRDAYYAQERFGDLFVTLERAPEALGERIEAIPGVSVVYTRVVAPARIPIDLLEGPPPIAEIVSLPGDGRPPANGVALQRGRFPTPGRRDEALLLHAFAERFGVEPGDTLPVVVEGGLERVRVTGTATSPEFIYPVPPGAGVIPDDERFAVLWMDRRAVAPMLGMEGAFNDVVLRLERTASSDVARTEVERLLEPYGVVQAVGRELQPSEYVLSGELDQLRSLATVVPLIFLGVAAFLLNTVLSRIVRIQRMQVATLKAVGYPSWRIGLHYLTQALLIVGLGVLIGALVGSWLGRLLTGLYAQYFGLPLLVHRVGPDLFVAGSVICLAAGAAGAMSAVASIVRLPPATAMQPPAPARYRSLGLRGELVRRLLGQSGRMILREIARRPLRAFVSILGIAVATATLVVGRFSYDALERLIDIQFGRIWKEDMTVSLFEARPMRAVGEALHLPGVLHAEGLRVVPARVRVGHRWRDVPVYGYPEGTRLRALMDADGESFPVPVEGIALTTKLGEILGVSIGDRVEVEVREGDRPIRSLAVTGLVDEMLGLQGHMHLDALGAFLGEAPATNVILLEIDEGEDREIVRRLSDLPAVADVARSEAMVRRFREQSGEVLVAMTVVLTLFAAAIAIGVIYNNTRVALSMRERDLASLRVLGLTRAEISGILLGEQAVQVALGVPIGLWLGRWMAWGLVRTIDPERYRLPIAFGDATYAFAATVVLVAAVASALVVRRRIDRLDLIGVLKTRE